MGLGTVPPAIDQMGQTTIWFVPTLASPAAPKASTELNIDDVTYSFRTGGFNVTSTQEKNPDERLSLLTVLQSLGKVSYDFAKLMYVDSTDVKSATKVLAPTAPATTISGFFVVRVNIPTGTAAATGQKGTAYPVTLGPQRRGELDGGKFYWEQDCVLTGPPVEATFAS